MRLSSRRGWQPRTVTNSRPGGATRERSPQHATEAGRGRREGAVSDDCALMNASGPSLDLKTLNTRECHRGEEESCASAGDLRLAPALVGLRPTVSMRRWCGICLLWASGAYMCVRLLYDGADFVQPRARVECWRVGILALARDTVSIQL